MVEFSEAAALAGYLSLVNERPELFRDEDRRGIRILTDRREIEAAQASARLARLREGADVTDLRAGLLARDPYMMMLRDAVRFPDGSLGLYNRVVEDKCVAVLPMLDDRLVLINVFRHGLRDWSLEFPRGGCEPGEPPDEAVRRELHEEIGAEADELVSLGDFSPGGSSLSIRAELFAARIASVGAPDRSDGIGEIRLFGAAEVEELMRTSRIIDGFTLALFLRARLAGLL